MHVLPAHTSARDDGVANVCEAINALVIDKQPLPHGFRAPHSVVRVCLCFTPAREDHSPGAVHMQIVKKDIFAGAHKASRDVLADVDAVHRLD